MGGIGLLGGCDSWLSGIGNSLTTSLNSAKVLNIKLSVYDGNKRTEQISSCDDSLSSTLIMKSINKATRTGVVTACISTNKEWTSKICNNGKIAFCVDCIDPCSTDQCVNFNAFNPCGNDGGNEYGCADRNDDVNAYRILSVVYEPLSLPPIIHSKNIIITKNSAMVNMTLVDINGIPTRGVVNCGYFPFTILPNTVSDVIIQGYQSSSSQNGIVNVLIDELSPITKYDIYCVTQNSLGFLMSYQDSLNSVTTITTLCCKTVTIDLSILSLFQNFGAVNAIQVSLDALPSNSLKLDLNVKSIGNSQISSTLPGTTTFTSKLKKKKYTYSIASVSTQSLGEHSIVAALSGPSAIEYDIIYVRKNFTVLTTDTLPSIPQILYVRFSNDGTSVNVIFDSETNKGDITTATFDCSRMFLFSGVATSTCSWISPSSIQILLGSSATLYPGNSIFTFNSISNIMIQSKCFFTKSKCLNYLPMVNVTMPILKPLIPVKPKIGISAPLIIGNCDNYVLDLSSSTGNCGRTFSNISFSVSTNGNVSEAMDAERILNNLFQISPPTSIPSGTFPEGLNNIQIKLCNFLGVCSQASTQLNVLTNSAPIVTISGKATISQESLAPLILYGDATMTICSKKISSTKKNLQYTWKILKNNHQVWNITSKSKRKNVFSLKPYALLPNNLYTFQLIVIDSKSSQSSMQSVNVNVIDSNIVAIIDGGEERTAQLGETFVLDASRSYDMNTGKKIINMTLM